MKDKIAEVLGILNVSTEDLKHEKFGPNIIKTYRKLSTEKSQTDGYYIMLKKFLRTPIRDFENYLRILTGLNEDDIQFILKQYNSKFVAYKISPGVHTLKNLTMILSRGFITEYQNVHLRPDRIIDKSD